jgi:hypothetical protein
MAPIKRKRGRPSSAEVLAHRASAAEVLQGIDQQRMWTKFLYSEDERVSLDAWKYLNDRVHGKPAQAVDMTSKGEKVAAAIVIDI